MIDSGDDHSFIDLDMEQRAVKQLRVIHTASSRLVLNTIMVTYDLLHILMMEKAS